MRFEISILFFFFLLVLIHTTSIITHIKSIDEVQCLKDLEEIPNTIKSHFTYFFFIFCHIILCLIIQSYPQ